MGGFVSRWQLNQLPPLLERRRVVPDRAQSCQAEGFYRQQLKRLEYCAQRDDSRFTVKSQLIVIVASVLIVGCGQTQQSAPVPRSKPEPSTTKAPNISIHQGVFDGNIGAVKQHLDAGTDVNAKAYGGSTPLHRAAFDGHKEIAELLIGKGADVNAKNQENTTPLDKAIEKNQPELANLLRKHGGKTGEELKAEATK